MTDASTQTLGQRIRALRKEKHSSTRELATSSHISHAFLSDIELGRRFPSTNTLRSISTALDADFDNLFLYHPRALIEALTKRIFQDPKMRFALLRIVEADVSADDLIALANQKAQRREQAI